MGKTYKRHSDDDYGESTKGYNASVKEAKKAAKKAAKERKAKEEVPDQEMS